MALSQVEFRMNASDSSRENGDGNYKTDSTEADANGLARLNEVREDIPQITKGSEVYARICELQMEQTCG